MYDRDGGLEVVEAEESAHTCTPECRHHDEGHSHGFQTFVHALSGTVHAERFQKFLEGLPAEVFRAKGFLRVEGAESPYLFHLVGRRFRPRSPPEWFLSVQNWIGRGFGADWRRA